MSMKSDIIQKQRSWAIEAGLEVDERGYLENYEKNLYQPLNSRALEAFSEGSGSELLDRGAAPAKMRALHSSSALAVNCFHIWATVETPPLMEALGMTSESVDVRFEQKFPTGLPGTPPNLDVVLGRADGSVIAIESKFTEWMGTKPRSHAPFREAYFPPGEGVWEKVSLPRSQRLAEDMQSSRETFVFLDAPQLLKHALGLATQLGSGFRLFYVYYDGTGAESGVHRSEIDRFSARVKSELGFRAVSYQDLISRLQERPGVPVSYLRYLRRRYF